MWLRPGNAVLVAADRQEATPHVALRQNNSLALRVSALDRNKTTYCFAFCTCLLHRPIERIRVTARRLVVVLLRVTTLPDFSRETLLREICCSSSASSSSSSVISVSLQRTRRTRHIFQDCCTSLAQQSSSRIHELPREQLSPSQTSQWPRDCTGGAVFCPRVLYCFFPSQPLTSPGTILVYSYSSNG